MLCKPRTEPLGDIAANQPRIQFWNQREQNATNCIWGDFIKVDQMGEAKFRYRD